METFSALLAICAGNSPVTGQWRGALMFSFICAWINSWVNNHEAGDFRRHRAHYKVIVMRSKKSRRWCHRDKCARFNIPCIFHYEYSFKVKSRKFDLYFSMFFSDIGFTFPQLRNVDGFWRGYLNAVQNKLLCNLILSFYGILTKL